MAAGVLEKVMSTFCSAACRRHSSARATAAESTSFTAEKSTLRAPALSCASMASIRSGTVVTLTAPSTCTVSPLSCVISAASCLAALFRLLVLGRQGLDQPVQSGIAHLAGEIFLVGGDETHAAHLDVEDLPP